MHWALQCSFRRTGEGGGGAVVCIVTSIPGCGGLHTSNSKAGEGTRCRRARTSCRRRTCGHLRFVIGQCTAWRSPTCTPRKREGASWPLAARRREEAANLQVVQGLPAEEIVWGRSSSRGYVPLPFSLFFSAASIVRSVMSVKPWRDTPYTVGS